jgi:hypothetical protein
MLYSSPTNVCSTCESGKSVLLVRACCQKVKLLYATCVLCTTTKQLQPLLLLLLLPLPSLLLPPFRPRPSGCQACSSAAPKALLQRHKPYIVPHQSQRRIVV